MNHLLSHRISCHGGMPRVFLSRRLLHGPPSSVYVVTHPWRSLLSDGEQRHSYQFIISYPKGNSNTKMVIGTAAPFSGLSHEK